RRLGRLLWTYHRGSCQAAAGPRAARRLWRYPRGSCEAAAGRRFVEDSTARPFCPRVLRGGFTRTRYNASSYRAPACGNLLHAILRGAIESLVIRRKSLERYAGLLTFSRGYPC